MGIACRIFTFTTQYPSLLFPGTTQFSSDPAPEGIDITREVSSVNPLTWIRAGWRLRRAKPDAVIVRYWIPVMAPAFGTVCRIARRGGVRTIALLDNVIPREKRPFDKWLTRYFLGSIDGFVYMSNRCTATCGSSRRRSRLFSLRIRCWTVTASRCRAGKPVLPWDSTRHCATRCFRLYPGLQRARPVARRVGHVET
ncbi:MAG: hypothetical protein ACLR8Y_05550 [Alistipes indistinctus]